MRSRIATPFLTLVLLLLASAGVASAQAGNIMGRVTDGSSGAPLAATVVQALGAGGQVAASTLTDASGTFRLVNLAPGTYTVRVTMTGYAAFSQQNVVVTAGQTTSLSVALTSTAFELNPIVVTGSRRPERALDSPARVEVVGAEEIEMRPATTPVDHLRNVPGVDIVQTGVQSTNVVARGFNNIFSGALYALTDHRIAGVPSLRVNLLHMVPATNEDIERMEIVLGPGSALYGPNTANGVLHILTRSPLSQQGTTVTMTAGERSLLNPTFRTAHLFGENFGLKISGEWLRANEWEHTDATELAERTFADANPAFWQGRIMAAEGISAEEAQLRFSRIGQRDEQVERWAGEIRADWAVTPALNTIFSAGRSHSVSGVELTGLGAAQVSDWAYSYYQARATFNRLFAQFYLNTSDAGNTYLLRDGKSIFDQSRLAVAQLQHGFGMMEGRQNFTYGVDFIHTDPRTGGTIHGRHEDNDNMTEVGGYLQSETAISPRLDLVLAGRADHHSHLDDLVFSPRAALVFKPAENQSVRASFNSAFSTPSAINLFLDLGTPFPATAAALSQLGYSVRVQGTQGGIRMQTGNGWEVRSPIPNPVNPAYNPNPGQLITPQSQAMWQQAVLVMWQSGAFGTPGTPQADGTRDAMWAQTPADPTAIAINYWNPSTGEAGRLAMLDIPDVPQIRQSNTQTFELGYKGVLANRFLLAADVWYSRKNDFVTPLMLQTPFVVLDRDNIATYMQPRFAAMGHPDPAAAAAAFAVGMSGIPLGVVSSADVSAQGSQALMTYRNFGDIDLWGSDISLMALLTDALTLGINASFVNEDHFFSEGQLITLNAPARKAGMMLGYRAPAGFNAEARARYTAGYPASSGVYHGTGCVEANPTPLSGQCVESYTLYDLTLGYRIPMRMRNAPSVQFTVNNLFDTEYQAFPGVPALGRMAMLRLRYDF
jgi:outer membrane receptor for ferrienterochelin and colicins